MYNLQITKELKNDIENNQIQLQNAILNHQRLFLKSKDLQKNEQLLDEIEEAENEIVSIGTKQKKLLDRLRQEYKDHLQNFKKSIVRVAQEERSVNLNISLNRARKQNLNRSRSSPNNSTSEDYEQRVSSPTRQNPEEYALMPQDLTQIAFLSYLRLATHEVFTEMQKKRAERKRRSTANSLFIYEHSRNRDYYGQSKKKKSHFLGRSISPPNTRGRKQKEIALINIGRGRISPPVPSSNVNHYHQDDNAIIRKPFSTIPSLPNGLIIEKINNSSSNIHQCVICNKTGDLIICDQCSNGFHLSCHNRPFSRTPKDCPRCLIKEDRRCSSSSSSCNSSGMMISSYTSPSEISEKLHLKQELQEKHKNLVAELTQLQNRHSELTISLKNQKTEQDEFRNNNKETEAKIEQLIQFIESIKNLSLPEKR